MDLLHCVSFNYEAGGQRRPGVFDFAPLADAFGKLQHRPALVFLQEAKNWKAEGGSAANRAAEAISDARGASYTMLLGYSAGMRTMPPAILFDPTVLILRQWWGDDPDCPADKRNVARFALRGSAQTPNLRAEFMAFVCHLSPLSGAERLTDAQRLSRQGTEQPLPSVGAGDFNATPSGAHLPQRDWSKVPPHQVWHKGVETRPGVWGPDTRAPDVLLGRCEGYSTERVGGSGMYLLPELDWREDPAREILPSVNTGVDVGGGLLIDLPMVNRPMLAHYVVGSYQVHIPDPMYPPPSDHRLQSWTLRTWTRG